MHRNSLYGLTLILLVAVGLSEAYVQPVQANYSWIFVRDTVTGAYGEAVIGTGNAIYVARRNGFYRYNPSDNSWTPLKPPPSFDSGVVFQTGTALAWDFNDSIYALLGAATGKSRRWFYRYRISQDSWEVLANTTAEQGEGNAMTWVGVDNCIYATIGGEQRPTFLVRYDPSTNSWSNEPSDPPAGMGDGASLVWTGNDCLYALRGEFDEKTPFCDFWRYNLTSDCWTAMADIPANAHSGGSGGVGDGGSLLYIGFWMPEHTNFIYALSGNQAFPDGIPDNRTYRYSISLNCWERIADLPFGVGYYVGCRLGYAQGCIYAWQGAPSTWSGGGDDLAKCELSPDATPPTIGIPARNPSGTVQPDQPVRVSAEVNDEESGVKNVTLFYTVENATIWKNRTMNYNGSTGFYESVIPGQPAGEWVKFKIVAYDYAGNNATRNGTSPYCVYYVVPEFPLTLIFTLLALLSVLAVLFSKKGFHLVKKVTVSVKESSEAAC